MILQQLVEAVNQSQLPGTYAAVKYCSDSLEHINKYIKDNNIRNSVSLEDIHTTLLYSRKHCPNYTPAGKIDPPWSVKVSSVDVWKSDNDNGETVNIVVLKVQCDELHDRHNTLMDEHKATYDFDEYIPHITLSYDAGDVDLNSLNDVSSIPELNIIKEYGEDLK